MDLTAALTPLTDILNDRLESFIVAAFSVEETNFIISFETASPTDAGKATLVAQIKTVQQNLQGLINSNANQIRAHVAGSFGLTDEQATIVLENLMVSPGPESLLARLADESLIAVNALGEYEEISSANFSGHFNAYALLHKVSLLVTKMRMETKDLEWFIINSASVDTLDFSGLPLAAVGVNDFDKWYNLHLFLQFRSKFPEPENASMRSVLELAGDDTHTQDEIFAEIAELTQWDSGQISSLPKPIVLHPLPLTPGIGRRTVFHLILSHYYKPLFQIQETALDEQLGRAQSLLEAGRQLAGAHLRVDQEKFVKRYLVFPIKRICNDTRLQIWILMSLRVFQVIRDQRCALLFTNLVVQRGHFLKPLLLFVF